MKFHKIIKNKMILTITLFCTVILASADAQEYLSPAFKWEPQFGFAKYIQNIIQKDFYNIKEMKLLNYGGTVSIVAIPTLDSPIRDLEQLAEGKTIGGIFLSTGSVRLNLSPGAYRVVVVQKRKEWRALFLDSKNTAQSEVSAQVTRAPRVDRPYAYVDRSICHRFDETLVCY